MDTVIIHAMYAKQAPRPLSSVACIKVLDACRVSAHYLIDRSGKICRLVEEKKRAWHAGVSRLPYHTDRRRNVNDFSIGIELIAKETTPYTAKQYTALARLTEGILKRHPIKYILGHQHIAPHRKRDPGPRFDWKKYQRLVVLRWKPAKAVIFGPPSKNK